MPNRIIRDSALTSPSLSALSHGAERLFWRLTVLADDQGRFDADCRVIRARAFPLLIDSIRSKEVEGWRQELADADCIHLYTVEGREYGQFCNWAKYQRIYGTKSKFPEPAAACGEPPQTPALIRYPISDIRESRIEKKKDSMSGSEQPDPARPSGESSKNGHDPAWPSWTLCEELMAFLNEKTGKYFQARTAQGAPSAALTLIRARLRDCGTEHGEQIVRAVIARKCRQWTSNDEMSQYLRPETLFGKKKFESYRGEVPL